MNSVGYIYCKFYCTSYPSAQLVATYTHARSMYTWHKLNKPHLLRGYAPRISSLDAVLSLNYASGNITSAKDIWVHILLVGIVYPTGIKYSYTAMECAMVTCSKKIFSCPPRYCIVATTLLVYSCTCTVN